VHPVLQGPREFLTVRLYLEDQDGHLLSVKVLAQQAWRAFNGNLAAFARHIDQRFAPGKALPLRMPTLLVVKRGCAVMFSLEKQSNSCLGAQQLPAKTAHQYATEAHVFARSVPGPRAGRRKQSIALTLVMDGLKAAHAEDEGLLAIVLQNIAAAELELGSHAVALAFAVAAWRLRFPQCPPKATLRAVRVLRRLDAYEPALLLLSRV
jgi:hypothetical protein